MHFFLIPGTGSSCIYPLLCAKLNGWTFLATEVDESSLRYAENNVKHNGLTDKITGTPFTVQHTRGRGYTREYRLDKKKCIGKVQNFNCI
jgi:methylase of polypeptide subunit release factors